MDAVLEGVGVMMLEVAAGVGDRVGVEVGRGGGMLSSQRKSPLTRGLMFS